MSSRDDFPILASLAGDSRSNPIKAEAEAMFDHIDQLRADLDRTQLADIESRNPGIDMDRVRAFRAMQETTQAASRLHTAGVGRPRIVRGDPHDRTTWVDTGEGDDHYGTLIIPTSIEWPA
jgi:hypothetical protein